MGKRERRHLVDSEYYSKEDAEAEFEPYQGITKQGYSYTGYRYEGQEYHDVDYLGEFSDDELPNNDGELIDSILKNK